MNCLKYPWLIRSADFVIRTSPRTRGPPLRCKQRRVAGLGQHGEKPPPVHVAQARQLGGMIARGKEADMIGSSRSIRTSFACT